MGIVSYAQNFEDVLLWRALGHVQHGFYVDIGAQDPVEHSVSRAFYEHGWRGVNVEPTTHYAELLRRDRPEDRVLEVAIAERRGSLAFYEIPDTGLSTADAEIAENHRLRGHQPRQVTVDCLTLDDLFDEIGPRDVHWLKIDVEGYEHKVLEGWRSAACRPWIVVAESTYPMTQVATYEQWEPLLLAKGYVFAHADGLSRFYVSTAHLELRPALAFGPNVFDEFQLADQAWPARSIVRRLHDELDVLTREKQNAEEQFELARNGLLRTREEADLAARRLAEAADQERRVLNAEIERVRSDAELIAARIAEAHAHELESLRSRVAQLQDALDEALRTAAGREADMSRELHDTTTRLGEQLQVRLQQMLEHEREGARTVARAQAEAREREHALQSRIDTLNADLLASAHDARRRERLAQRRHLLELRDLRQALDASVRRQHKREGESAQHAAALRASTEAAVSAADRRAFASAEREAQALRQVAEVERSTREFCADLRRQGELRESALTRELSDARAAVEGVAAAARALRGEDVQPHDVTTVTSTTYLHAAVEVHRHLSEMTRAQRELRSQLAGRTLELQAAVDELTAMQRSVGWRMLAPFRAIFGSGVGSASGSSSSSPLPTSGVDDTNVLARQLDIDEDSTANPSQATPEAQRDGEYGPAGQANSLHAGVEDSEISTPAQTGHSHGTPMEKPEHVDDLMRLHGSAFINAAYRHVLGRAPDPAGERYYMRRLASGAGKAQIIKQLAVSKEGAAKADRLPGLDALAAQQRAAKHWFWGRLGSGGRIEQQVHRIENEIGDIQQALQQFQEDSAHRFARIESWMDRATLERDPDGKQARPPEPAPARAPGAWTDTSGLSQPARQIFARLTRSRLNRKEA